MAASFAKKMPLVQKWSLIESLNHAAMLYYALDNPELTDAEFDWLLIELQQLEAAYPELVTEDIIRSA